MKRYSYLSWHLLVLFSVLILEFLLLLVLWQRQVPVTGQDLVLLLLVVVFPLGLYWHLSTAFRLFEDRIAIAPEWMLTWKEFGATVEIKRSLDASTPPTIHVYRYTADCPQCGRMIKLDKGEPDFPRRIVGRCEENPREHVYSFDRSSRLGKPLGPSVGSPRH